LAYGERITNDRLESGPERTVKDAPETDVFSYESEVSYHENADQDWKKNFARLFKITIKYLMPDGRAEDNSRTAPQPFEEPSRIPPESGWHLME
jgi:hypothetical protein